MLPESFRLEQDFLLSCYKKETHILMKPICLETKKDNLLSVIICLLDKYNNNSLDID